MTVALKRDFFPKAHFLLIVHPGKARPPLVPPHIANRAILILVANHRLPEPIQLLRVQRVEKDGERERDEEPDQRHTHRDMVALVIGHQTRQTREQGAAGDGSDDPGGTAFRVAAEPADRQREDGGEDAGFEEEDEREHGDAAFALGAHGGRDEDHYPGHEDHEHPAGLDEHHQPRGGEPSDGEEALADGIPIRARGVADLGGLDAVLDELARDADLRPDVAELSRDAEEEFILLAQRAVDESRQARGLFRLQRHVGIRDLGDGGEVKHDGEEEHKRGDPEVRPLHVAQVRGIGVLEEDARGEQRRHHGPDSLEGLAQLEAKLGKARRAAGGDERVRARFQGRQPGPDDEQRAAEAAEGAVDGRRPEHEGADAVDAQPRDEGPAVAELAHHPSRIRGRADEVGAEVGALQPPGFGRGDVERVLEFGVQHVQEPVGEAPEEEEHGHERDGHDGLPHCQRGGAGEAFVGDGFAVLLGDGVGVGGAALVEDFGYGGLFGGEETHFGGLMG